MALTRKIKRKNKNKTLVLFCFHKYIQRVKDFVENAVFPDKNVDFLFISNDKKVNVSLPSYVKLIKRDNVGYDFGAWSDGLLTDNLYKKYNNFIFVNSSVSGPFLPEKYEGKWTDIYLDGLKNNVKLFGSTINTIRDPLHRSHVQSYIFCLDKETLEHLILCGIFSKTNYAKSFIEAVYDKEVLMSRKIIEKGWNIGSLLPLYDGVDFTFKNKHPKDYDIRFMGDVMFDKYMDKLWKKTDLVFVKGNRIECRVDCKL